MLIGCLLVPHPPSFLRWKVLVLQKKKVVISVLRATWAHENLPLQIFTDLKDL